MQGLSFLTLRMQLLRDLKITNNTIFRRVVILALAFMAIVSLFAGAKNALCYSQDFQWDAAKALMLKMDPYELSLNPDKVYESSELTEFYRLFTDMGLKQKMEANQFPSLLMLLYPYAMLAPFTARIAWLLSNIVFTAGIIFLLRKTFLKKLDAFEFALVALLMIAGTPFRNQLGVGQHTLFSFCCFMLAVYLDEISSSDSDVSGAPNNKRACGFSIGITLCLFVSYFKYTLTAPLALYFVYKKRYKELIISILMHVALTAVSALTLGKSVFYMLTAPLKVAMNLSSEGGLDIGALVGGGVLSLAIAAIIGIGLLILSIKLPKGSESILIPVLIFWSLIMTYHRTYDFFVLSVAVMMFVSDDGKDNCKLSDNSANKFAVNGAVMFWGYWLVILAVYFGLRLFNENTFSRIAVGAVYYIFTLLVTYGAVKKVSLQKEKSEGI